MTTPKSKGKGRKASRVSSQKGNVSGRDRDKQPRRTAQPKKVSPSTRDAVAALTKPISFAPLQDLYAPPPPRYGEVARLQEDTYMLRKTMERLTKRLERLSARAMLPTEENGVDVTTVQTSRYQRMQMVWDAAVAVCEAETETPPSPTASIGALRKCIRDLRGLLIGGGE